MFDDHHGTMNSERIYRGNLLDLQLFVNFDCGVFTN